MPHYLKGYDDKDDYKEFNCLIPNSRIGYG